MPPKAEPEKPWFAPPPELNDEIDADSVLDLSTLLSIALSNNPQTREAWASAREAAAAYGSARGEYYPQISIGGGVEVSNTQDPNDYLDVSTGDALWLIQGGATLTYLLTDFGGRRARVGAARQALYAANWLQNQTLQDVVREVTQAYYAQQGLVAEVAAYRVNLENAETTSEAAQVRLDVGVGTIADVLQSQANAAQVQVDLAGAEGQTMIAQGDLATAVGWPANTRFSIEPFPEELPFDALAQDADRLIDLAYKNRPALAAALAEVRLAEQQVRQAKSSRRPAFSAIGQGSEQVLRGAGANDGQNFIYEFGVGLTIPIFTGGTLRSDLKAAEANLQQAKAQLTDAEQQVVAAVWTGYYDFRTAVDQAKANEVLLASSAEAYDVSLERFRNGLGDIVELLQAQALLAAARAQLVQSRTDVMISYAELVYAVGRDVPTKEQ